MAASVLIVEDDQAAAVALREAATLLGMKADFAANGEEAVEYLNRQSFRLLVAERTLPGIDGLALARRGKELHPDMRILILATKVSPEWEQRAQALGVEWFLSNPPSAARLRETLARILSATPGGTHAVATSRVEDSPSRPAAIIGTSEPIQEIFRLIEKARNSRAPVLIHGESGTGKELVARAISQGGPSEGKLVVVNCCALSDSLIESELFGHARGSFSGALTDREGLFETADGGTLFLDEIGDIPLRSQTKLLRVLQEGEFRRVGENKLRHVQVRILTATNRNLREAIEHRQFREDLYYRLNVIPIYLPPLRERVSDIPLLVAHFLHKHRRKNQAALGLGEAALARLMGYAFPGNIRELENIMQRAISLAKGTLILEKEITSCLQAPENTVATTPVFSGHTYGELKQHLRTWERRFLEERLRAHDFHVTETAHSLGVARTALHNRIKTLGIQTSEPDLKP